MKRDLKHDAIWWYAVIFFDDMIWCDMQWNGLKMFEMVIFWYRHWVVAQFEYSVFDFHAAITTNITLQNHTRLWLLCSVSRTQRKTVVVESFYLGPTKMVLCCGTYSDHQNTDVSICFLAACQIPTVSTHISSGKHCVNGEIPRPQILLVTVEPDKPGGSFQGKGNVIS